MATSKAVATAPPQDQTALKASAPKLISLFAERYGVDQDKMLSTLKQTAFRQRKPKGGGEVVEVTNEQMMMLLVVANEYKLNPFTREIYAFPSENGIVPIISIDGWIRIINERPELHAISFEVAPTGTEDPWISCTIERKDRSRPITITEYLSECSRDTGPWNEMPRRMLRHKALIQCARVAFGFAGVYDPDEGDRVIQTVERETAALPKTKPMTIAPQSKSEYREAPTKEQLDPDVERLTVDQATALNDKIVEEGVRLSMVLAHFEVGNIEEIPAASYVDAIKYVDELSKDAGSATGG